MNKKAIYLDIDNRDYQIFFEFKID